MTDLTNVTKAYGDALFMLSEEICESEKIIAECELLTRIIEENPDYLKMLDSPALSCEKRLSLIDESFSSFSKILVNTAKLLAEKRIAHALPKVLSHYKRIYELSRGIERVEVISAVLLSESQKARLKSKLEEITQKQIIINNTHDPSILGGMKLRYMGKQIDGSIKSKLEAFEKRLDELVI